jgi:pyroglutamyl-peptidase
MNKLLFTGFNGNTNSSKVFLEHINKDTGIDLLILENDFKTSEKQLIDKIKENAYNIVFSFGQKPVIKSVYIETIAANGDEKLETNYNYSGLKNHLEKYFKIKISENAGNYLCNNIYYKGLKYILSKKLKTQMIFIHIPYLNNIDVKYFSKIMVKYAKNILLNTVKLTLLN